VLSDAAGEVEIAVPSDRESTFEAQIVKKRQRRLNDLDEIVLSLYTKGLTTGEISAHFASGHFRAFRVPSSQKETGSWSLSGLMRTSAPLPSSRSTGRVGRWASRLSAPTPSTSGVGC
jgi:hypothetical protein